MFQFFNIQIETVAATRREATCLTRSYVDSITRRRKLILGHAGPSKVTTAGTATEEK